MATESFFSQKNEAMLQRVLYNDVCRRTGNDLNEKQASRLIKTVKHYMGEVHRVKGSSATMNSLNTEVLSIVLPDYMMYLERNELSEGRVAVADIEAGPGISASSASASSASQSQLPALLDGGSTRIQQDLTTAFSQLQASRQETKSRPPLQDFRLSLQDEGPVSMDTFEKMKNEREAEAMRVQLLQQQREESSQALTLSQGQSSLSSGGQQGYAAATDIFARSNKRATEESENAFAERERKALESRAASSQIFTTAAPPDMRQLFMGDRQTIDRRLNANGGNPTIQEDSRVTGGQQMLITREPSTMAYKETELNLFVYSGDRDWVSNSSETRYNFSVNFDPSNMPLGLRLAPSSTVKFRNIVRAELVKAIMPGEGLDTTMVTKTSATSYDSSVNVNILSYPYIQVRIPELDNNIYGTNQGLNAAFGVLQYDANWISDTGLSNQRGYLAMIPKFLKCQKVYQPTPLATLQRLSFRFERPDGSVLSTVPDTLDIAQIYPTLGVNSSVFPGGTTYTYYVTDPAVDVTASAYYWIKTSNYFNHWTVSKGDRIVVKNVNWASLGVQPLPLSDNGIKQMTDFMNFIQQDAGLLVVDTGYISLAPGAPASSTVFTSQTNTTAAYNSQGYANAILVRGKFTDASTGSVVPANLGGVPDSYSTTDLLANFLTNNPVTSGRLLNQSHQVQVAMRIITRELDSTGILRPDNL